MSYLPTPAIHAEIQVESQDRLSSAHVPRMSRCRISGGVVVHVKDPMAQVRGTCAHKASIQSKFASNTSSSKGGKRQCIEHGVERPMRKRRCITGLEFEETMQEQTRRIVLNHGACFKLAARFPHHVQSQGMIEGPLC